MVKRLPCNTQKADLKCAQYPGGHLQCVHLFAVGGIPGSKQLYIPVLFCLIVGMNLEPTALIGH